MSRGTEPQVRKRHGWFSRLGMFWRVYLFGVLLLASALGAMFGTAYLLANSIPSPLGEAMHDVDSLAKRWPEVELERAKLKAEVAANARKVGGKIAIYSLTTGELIAGDPTGLPPLTPEQLHALSKREKREEGARWHIYFSQYLPDEHAPDAYIRVMVPMLGPVVWRIAAFVAVILIALALVSAPFVRVMTSPLRKLTATARALGDGDLSVRSGIRRGDEVGVLAGALDEMAERVQVLIRGEKELLANVSHELRTPLARIRMALELAAEGDAEKVRRSLSDVQADLSELEALVGNILTTARLDLASGKSAPGQLPLHRSRVDCSELVGRCAERFRDSTPSRTLELAVEPGLPPLEVDGGLVRRAIDNLVDNARKYSDASTAIRVIARRYGEGVELEVQDRGIGIEPADLERLFTPFFRTDRSRARGTGGVGLGLALAKRIAEAHGGSIHARSTPGEGTAIALRLPAAPAA